MSRSKGLKEFLTRNLGSQKVTKNEHQKLLNSNHYSIFSLLTGERVLNKTK